MLQAFAVFDIKTDSYSTPFFFPNKEVAMRSIGDIVNNEENHQFYKYPSDFGLWYLGDFDSKSVEDPLIHFPRFFVCTLSDLKYKEDSKYKESAE